MSQLGARARRREWHTILLATAVLSVPMAASAENSPSGGRRAQEEQVRLKALPRLHASFTPIDVPSDGSGGVAGDCPQEIVTHTDANFGGGTFNAQAGFAENEIAAASYVVPAGDFPLRVDLIEMVFATSGATVQTVTQWSVLVWEGTPNTGTLVAQFSSDDVILPHIRLGPGTQGTNVQVSVDPGDPEQIIVGDNGSHTFSVGFRIDQHNNQTQDPCLIAPPSNSNAFPTTDTSGLASPAGNWLFAVSGPFCLCDGWNSFQALPAFCRPTGDWVLRATYTPTFCTDVQGACCLTDGSCLGPVTQPVCVQTLNGTFEGQGSVCLPGLCPQPTQACCFEGAPPSCANLTIDDCNGFGGTLQGVGTNCASTVCFPVGACCSPLGTCTNDVAQADCEAGGGTFQGNATLCSGVSCPQPTGACCSNSTTFCSVLTQASCSGVPNTTWAGALTDCVDGNSNGEADACEGTPGCATNAQCDDNNVCTCDRCVSNACVHTPVEYGNTNCAASPVNPNLDDILCVLAGFANFSACISGDIAPTTGPQACQGNDIINLDDILAVLAAFGGNDPCGCVP